MVGDPMQRVRVIVCRQLGVNEGEVMRDTLLADELEADSLAIFDLAAGLEEAFGIEIPDDLAHQARTVGDIVDLVAAQIAVMEGPATVTAVTVTSIPLRPAGILPTS